MRPHLVLFVLVIWCGCAGEPEPQPPADAAAPATERGANPDHSGSWSLAGDRTLVLGADDELVLGADAGAAGRTVAQHVVGTPAVDGSGRRLAFAHRPGDGIDTELAVMSLTDGEWGEPAVLVTGGLALDRVAISDDGARVAYVAPADGIAALWIVPFDGGEPVQLTNVGVKRTPGSGGPPQGFVPPPHREPPVFEGDRLVWESADGTHSVELP